LRVREGTFLVAGFFLAVAFFFGVVLRALVRLIFFLAVGFLAVFFLAVGFLAVFFLARELDAFFFARGFGVFLAVGFFPVGFFVFDPVGMCFSVFAKRMMRRRRIVKILPATSRIVSAGMVEIRRLGDRAIRVHEARGRTARPRHRRQETGHMTDTKQTSRLPGDEETATESSIQPDPKEEGPRPVVQIKGNDELYRLHREGRLGQGARRPDPTDPTRGFDVRPREYTVERDDNLPLRFTGRLVGWNEVDPSVPRGTRVTIFVTRSTRIVTAVHQWQRGEKSERSRHDAGVHDRPDEALAWLIRDGGNQLGRSSREAWEMACQVWPAFKGHDVEVID